jgi:hypothetical protein
VDHCRLRAEGFRASAAKPAARQLIVWQHIVRQRRAEQPGDRSGKPGNGTTSARSTSTSASNTRADSACASISSDSPAAAN